MPTNQETFDTVVAHLRKQNCKSQAWNSERYVFRCMYRGPNGTSCAVGCLIPDELYLEEYEHQGILSDRVYNLIGKDRPAYKLTRLMNETLGHDTELLQSLQVVHDRHNVKDWELMLQQVADEFNLIFSRVENLTHKEPELKV